MIRNLFRAPIFEKDEDNFRAKFINGFAWVGAFLLAFAMIPYLIRRQPGFTVVVLSALIIVLLFAIFLLRRGKINASGTVVIVLGWLGLGLQAYTADGVKDVIIVAYIALGLLASIVISWRAGGAVILTSLAAIWVLGLLEANGSIIARLQDPIQYSRDLSLIFLAISALIYFSTTSLRDAIVRANKSEESLLASNQILQDLNKNLETRVAERTSELEIVNRRNERRAQQFEAIAQVARAAITNQVLETLLPRLAELISHQFDYYHVGIFLLDEQREFAELAAANSEEGKHMLARGHKLGIGQSGIVGYVSATGKPRIALDVEADSAFFNNPDLPNTRSEMALPLRVADEVIGVLDVQSIVPNAFQEEDLDVLSTLADQVSIAIQNSRTYETMQTLLAEAQRTSGTYLGESWRVLQSQDESIGYQISENKLNPLTKPITSVQIKKAISSRETVREGGENATLAIPIRLRDEVIGIMNIRVQNEAHDWDPDEVDVAEAVADRLSLALEASLLLKSTQRKAEIERITADISGKLGAATQFDTILRTAAEELSRVLGGSDVLVQIQAGSVPDEL
ncbi:MAG TPA: GAF domain-containing protein [Anaerolineales bacterium]|nr:GAF domain-containing protein [Anaerolineales bacterium]